MQLPAAALPAGAVLPVEIDGREYVLWRGTDGRVRGGPRVCPHLDHDLAEGYVVGVELVCPGHGWAFDGDGNTYKRNEFGRVDPKGAVETLEIDEADDLVRVRAHAS